MTEYERQMKRAELTDYQRGYLHGQEAAAKKRNLLDLDSPEAERRLAAALHREDITGRAIHEEESAMQVPSYGPDECRACQRHARAIRAALRGSDETKGVTCQGYCGSLDWTVEQYGRVTHKHSCPKRTDTFCQTHPNGCPPYGSVDYP